MSSSRVATGVAIVAGGLIGAAAALLGSSASRQAPAPRSATRVPAPAATRSAAEERPAASGPEVDDAAPESLPSGYVTRYAPALDAKPEAVKAASLHCAWGRIEACLQTAAAFREGRGTAADPGEAKLYEHRARELSIDLCEEGHAEACYALAYMYEHGIAVDRKPGKVGGLLARVRMLCHVNAVPICRQVPRGADAG